MATQWYLYEDKDAVQKSLNKDVVFPILATNFKIQTKECVDKDELLEHILCEPRLPEIQQILIAKIHPEVFVSDDTLNIITHFMRQKTYTMSFLYPEGTNTCPNNILQAFDIIQSEISLNEKKSLEHLKNKDSKKSN